MQAAANGPAPKIQKAEEIGRKAWIPGSSVQGNDKVPPSWSRSVGDERAGGLDLVCIASGHSIGGFDLVCLASVYHQWNKLCAMVELQFHSSDSRCWRVCRTLCMLVRMEISGAGAHGLLSASGRGMGMDCDATLSAYMREMEREEGGGRGGGRASWKLCHLPPEGVYLLLM